MISLDMTIEYDDEISAKTVYESIFPDNEGYVAAEHIGNKISLSIVADNAGTLRNTADDLMACIKTAEEALGLVSGTAPDLDGDAFFE